MVLPEQIEQNIKGQSFLILTNRTRVWSVYRLYHHWEKNGCQWNAVAINLSLTTGSADWSKKAWKSSALSHIHNLLALVHITHTPLSLQTTLTLRKYVPQTQTSSLVNKLARWGIEELLLVRVLPKKLCEIWQPNTTQQLSLLICTEAVDPPDVQPIVFTKLGDHHSIQHMPQKKVTEYFLYVQSDSLC